MMSRRFPDGFEERVGGGDVRAAYVDVFACLGMTLVFRKALLELVHWRGEDYFGVPLLKA